MSVQIMNCAALLVVLMVVVRYFGKCALDQWLCFYSICWKWGVYCARALFTSEIHSGGFSLQPNFSLFLHFEGCARASYTLRLRDSLRLIQPKQLTTVRAVCTFVDYKKDRIPQEIAPSLQLLRRSNNQFESSAESPPSNSTGLHQACDAPSLLARGQQVIRWDQTSEKPEGFGIRKLSYMHSSIIAT